MASQESFRPSVTGALRLKTEKWNGGHVEVYDGAPVGAVFEATQKALQAMRFHIGRTDAATFAIVAHPGASAGTQEPSGLVGNLFDAIDLEIRKIRDAGRILPADGPKYGFGQAAVPPVPPPPAAAPVPPAPPVLPAQPVPESAQATPAAAAKSGPSGWFWKAAVIGGIVLLLNTKTGQDLLDEVMRSLSLETDIARYDCAKVVELVKGTKVQDLFGAQFEVLDIRNVTPATKTEDKIACTADLDLSNATTQRMTIMVRRGSSPSEIIYGSSRCDANGVGRRRNRAAIPVRFRHPRWLHQEDSITSFFTVLILPSVVASLRSFLPSGPSSTTHVQTAAVRGPGPAPSPPRPPRRRAARNP